MKKFNKIALLVIILALSQITIASETVKIEYSGNTVALTNGFEIEQLVNESYQFKLGFLAKIADWIGDWFPNWNFWQKTVGTGAGHYIEKDGTDITYPITLYDKTIFSNNEVFREKMNEKFNKDEFKTLFNTIFTEASATTTMTCTPELDAVCDVATKAKLAAFCYFMELKPEIVEINGKQVLIISECNHGETEMDNFLSIALDALNTMNTDVPVVLDIEYDKDEDEWIKNVETVQWRAKELMLYVQTYDFLKGAGVDDNLLITARDRIKRLTVEVYRRGKYFYFIQRNNYSLMIAGAIGMSAIVLHDYGDHWWNKDFLPDVWANAAHWNIEETIWDSPLFGRMSKKDEKAGYAEGPHYFSYAFQSLLPFFNTFSNYVQQETEHYYKYKGMIPNWMVILPPVIPFALIDYNFPKKVKNYNYDENYNNIYEWYHDILHPNGYAPSYDDCYYENYQKICGLINSKVGDPHKYNYFSNGDWCNVELRPDFLANAISPTIPNKDNFINEASGDLILRTPSSVELDKSHYLRVSAETGTAVNGGGHEHADLGSFIISAGKDLLALDPPAHHDIRKYTRYAVFHNSILINGNGPGKNEKPKNVEYSLNNTKNIGDQIFYDEIKLTMRYENKDVTRTFQMKHKEFEKPQKDDIYYYVVSDKISLNNEKTITWNLNGNGNITHTDTFRTFEIWDTTKSIVSWNSCNLPSGQQGWNLYANVGVAGGANFYRTVTKYDSSRHYDGIPFSSPIHTRLEVTKKSDEDIKIVAILIPYKCGVDTPLIIKEEDADQIRFHVKEINGESIEDEMVFSKRGYGSVQDPFGIDSNINLDYYADELSFNISPNYTFQSKGCIVNTNFRNASIKNGSSLSYNDTTFIDVQGGVRADVKYEIIGKFKYSGSVNTGVDAEIHYYLPDLEMGYDMHAINVETLQELDYFYDAGNYTMIINFDRGKTNFIFELSDPCLASCFFPSTQETIDTLFDFNTGTLEHLGHDLDIMDQHGHLKITNGSKVDICSDFVLVNRDSITMLGYFETGDNYLPVYTEYGEGMEPIIEEGEMQVDDRLVSRKSMIIVRDRAALVLNPNSYTHIGANSTILVKKGGTLFIRDNAFVEIGSKDFPGIGEIIVEDGAYLCIEPNVNLHFYENPDDTSDKHIFYIAMLPPDEIDSLNSPIGGTPYNPNKTGAYPYANSNGGRGKFLQDSIHYSNVCIDFCNIKNILQPDGINNKKYGWSNISEPMLSIKIKDKYCSSDNLKFDVRASLNEVYHRVWIYEFDTLSQSIMGIVYQNPDSNMWDTGRIDYISFADFEFENEKSYLICFMLLNDCGEKDSVTKVISFNSVPYATFTASQNACPGFGNVIADGSNSESADYHTWEVSLVYDYNYQYDDTNAFIYSMQYQNTGNVSGNFSFPDFYFFGGQKYEIKLTVYNSCGYSTHTDTIEIPLGAYIELADTMIYKDGIGDFSVQLIGHISGTESFQWFSQDTAFNQNILDPVVSPNITTDYILTVSNQGCSDADTVTVHVNQFANAGSDKIICIGDSVEIGYSNMNIPQGYTIEWSPDSSLSNGTLKNPYAKPIASTLYVLSVKDSSANIIENDAVELIVEDTLNSFFVAEFLDLIDDSFHVQFINLSNPLSNTSDFVWYFINSSDTSVSTNPKFKYPRIETDSSYFVLLISSNTCGIDSFLDTLYIKGDSSISIYLIASSIQNNETDINENVLLGNTPNPFNNSTTIYYQIQKEIKNAEIVIFDENGKYMKIIKLRKNSTSYILDWSSYAKGIYNYSLIIDGKLIATKKMIKL